jgi:hypothetical protein
MIRGLHGLFYTNEADAMRDFVRDKLKLPFSDVGEGWLIFDLPMADLGVHPTEGDPPSGTHAMSFVCDDIHGTVATLRARGVVFNGDVVDRGWGLVTELTMPGGVEIQLYEPKYTKTKAKPAKKAAKKPAAKRRPAKKR